MRYHLTQTLNHKPQSIGTFLIGNKIHLTLGMGYTIYHKRVILLKKSVGFKHFIDWVKAHSLEITADAEKEINRLIKNQERADERKAKLKEKAKQKIQPQ